jgi:protein TonB
VSLFFPKSYDNASDRSNSASGFGSALFVHGAIVAIAALGLGQSEKLAEIARPLTVRLVEAVHPEEKPPAPLPPKVVPKVLPKIVKQPVMVSNSPSSPSNFVVQEQPVAPVIQAAAPTRVQSAEPPVESVTEPRFDADYLSNPKPPYPSASRKLREEGTVYLRVHVDTDGRALKVELKKSSGISRLDQSALDTVAQWRFVPARRGSAQIASWVVVPIVFSLT